MKDPHFTAFSTTSCTGKTNAQGQRQGMRARGRDEKRGGYIYRGQRQGGQGGGNWVYKRYI